MSQKYQPIHDLSLHLEDGMITYPTRAHCPFEAAVIGRIEVEGRETRKFTIGSHCGTHIDAMRHFEPEGKTIDQIPPEHLVGQAYLMDLGCPEPGKVYERQELEAQWPEEPVERLVLRTQWTDRYWNTRQFYQDWPYLTREATQLLLDKQIKMLAIDFPSPDSAYYGNDCSLDCPNHKLLFSKEIVLVEYLTNLTALPAGFIFIAALPLKLKGFDGSPARVVAHPL